MRRRFDCVKFMIRGADNHPRHREQGRPTGYYVGRIMLIFRVHSYELDTHTDADGETSHWRDFCLIRRLMPAKREKDDANDAYESPYPYAKCEVRDKEEDPGMDWLPEKDRLGVLWVWAKDAHDQPIYEVLTAQEVVETYPVMPRWEGPGSKKWSIATGVFNNRFAPTGRWRPPFVDCPCQQPRAAEPQGDADDADAQ